MNEKNSETIEKKSLLFLAFGFYRNPQYSRGTYCQTVVRSTVTVEIHIKYELNGTKRVWIDGDRVAVATADVTAL